MSNEHTPDDLDRGGSDWEATARQAAQETIDGQLDIAPDLEGPPGDSQPRSVVRIQLGPVSTTLPPEIALSAGATLIESAAIAVYEAALVRAIVTKAVQQDESADDAAELAAEIIQESRQVYADLRPLLRSEVEPGAEQP